MKAARGLNAAVAERTREVRAEPFDAIELPLTLLWERSGSDLD